MGRYNNFITCVECPTCQKLSEVEFQSDIGRLEWRSFNLGDKVFGHAAETGNAPIGPVPGLEGVDFWAYGIGTCMKCKSDVYARIEIHYDKVDKIIVVSHPIESDKFNFLNQWRYLMGREAIEDK
jgi:hypothetical protein